MPLSPAPIQNPIASLQDALTPRVWVQWFTQIASILGSNPFPLPQYTLTTLPASANYVGSLIYVTNATGGGVVCYSRDGTTWRRVDTNAVVS